MSNSIIEKLKMLSVEDFKQSAKRLSEIFKNKDIKHNGDK